MNLHEFIHPRTRHAWTLRLVIYVAVVVTASVIVQFTHFWLA